MYAKRVGAPPLGVEIGTVFRHIGQRVVDLVVDDRGTRPGVRFSTVIRAAVRKGSSQ